MRSPSLVTVIDHRSLNFAFSSKPYSKFMQALQRQFVHKPIGLWIIFMRACGKPLGLPLLHSPITLNFISIEYVQRKLGGCHCEILISMHPKAYLNFHGDQLALLHRRRQWSFKLCLLSSPWLAMAFGVATCLNPCFMERTLVGGIPILCMRF